MTPHTACLSPLVTSGESPASGLGLTVGEVLRPQRNPALLSQEGDGSVGTAERPWLEALSGPGTFLSAHMFFLTSGLISLLVIICPARLAPQTLFPTWLGSRHRIKANIGGSNRLLCTHTIQTDPPTSAHN